MGLCEIIEVAAALCSCVSLVYAVITYNKSVNQERKVRTFVAIDALYEKHDELARKNMKDNYMDFVRFTRNVDRFAASYNMELFDKATVKERAGKFLLQIYDEKMRKIINQQRKQFNHDTYFYQTECMINDLRGL